MHATLSGANKQEDAVIDYLRGGFGHVSAERALSGGGIVNLYQALAAIDGVTVPEREASGITAAAASGTCPLSREALNMFCAMLGTFAGNAALTLRAQGGVFISGGIVPRIHGFLEQSQFRSRFEAKGRFSKHVSKIGTYVITHDDPAFIGLQALAEKMLNTVNCFAAREDEDEHTTGPAFGLKSKTGVSVRNEASESEPALRSPGHARKAPAIRAW